MVEIRNRYDALFQNMAQGVFFQEKSGALTDVNPAALEMFGLTRSQFLGGASQHPDWKVIKEDGSDLPPEQHPSMVALNTGQEVQAFVAGVYNPLRKGIIWLNINATPMFLDGEEKPYQTFVTLHDITPQMQTKKLYQSRLNLLDFAQSHTLEELLVFTLDEVEKLTDSMIGFYHFYDADTQEITLNAWSSRTKKQFCQVTSEQGHYPLEKAGVWVDCIREDRPVIHNDYQSLRHRKGLPEGHAQIVRELVVPVKRKDKVVAILGVGNKPRDYTEADIDTVMLFADMAWGIAEKKRSEGLLQQSESRYRALTETSMDGYWVVDASSRQIVAVNDTMSEIYGYDHDEFLTKSWLDLEAVEDDLLAKEHIEKIKAKGSDHFESKHRLKDGQIIDVEVGVSYLPESDNLLCFVRDISDRKTAEEELRNSEQLFRALFEQAGGYCMILDPNTTDGIPVIVDANEAACEMHGYTREEFIGRPVADIDDEEGKRLVKQRTAEIMTGKPFYVENVHVRKDGAMFDVAVNAKRIDIRTSPPLILTTEYDITDKKRAESELSRIKEDLQNTFDISPGLICVANVKSGYFIKSNPAVTKILGYSEEEFKNKPLFEFIHPDDRERTKDEVSKQLDGRSIANFENRYQCKDGSYKWLSWGGTRADSDGNLYAVATDITQLKQAQLELQNKQYSLSKAQEIGNIGTWELDIANNKLIWTDENCRIFGVPTGSVVNYEVFINKVHPEDRAFVDGAWQEAMLGKSYDIEHRLLVEEKTKWVREKADITFDDKGFAVSAIGVTQDITDQKQAEMKRLELEAQLRQKYKMEAVGVMAGGMAHNFNNNLAIILGNLELSKVKLPPQNEVGDYLEYAKTATVRSRELVKQIMTYSRTDVPSQVPLQLSSLLKEILSLLKSTIPSSVKLQQEVKPDCEQIYIQADSSQIQECLLNLCNNAVHAMEEQGELLLRLERLQLKQEDISPRYHCSPGEYLCLSVQDNGCGIPAEIQEKIFDPFFTTKELYEGTGMGLSTVQGIIEQHHGMITVASDVGQGTIFHLYFPVVDQLQREGVADKEAELQRGSERILYVDDDQMVANINERLLSEMGYQVTVMTNSMETLKLFSSNPDNFDLVMTDQTMPELTGIELIQKIKKLRPDLLTILCTGYSSKVNGEVARQLGISAFLMKPVSLPELSEVIRTVLEKPAA